MRRFITGDNYNCPYFRNDDEYELARKQYAERKSYDKDTER